jgi:hypothetical protein
MNTTTHSLRRLALRATVLGAAALIGTGCATMNTITSDVSSFGDWPAGRAPGTYAFERLPSQEARANDQAVVENAARGALERAGFKPAPAATADVLVQLNARLTSESSIVDDRWRAWPYVGLYGVRRGGWGVYGSYSPFYHQTTRAQREVAVLLRDRASGKTLYETRAINVGSTGFDAALLAASFDAAMKDFPKPALNPRRVDTELQPALPTAGPTPAQQQIVK